jgi:hypothetical protein
VRISTGTDEDLQMLIDALEAVEPEMLLAR